MKLLALHPDNLEFSVGEVTGGEKDGMPVVIMKLEVEESESVTMVMPYHVALHVASMATRAVGENMEDRSGSQP